MKLTKLLVPAALSIALAACGNLSKVSDEGTTDKPVWPKVEDSRFNSDGSQKGTWPNWDNVHMIEKGMNKDQIYHLIGRPHFAEGLFGVHEWDYVFNYRENGVHKICQYKILFDKNMEAQSFFWLPEGCSDRTEYQLSSDFRFDFDSANLKAGSQKVIADLVNKLPKDKQISIVGYTDRLGSDAYNLALSQRRAVAVKNAMVALGIPASHIQASGMGKADQVKACENETGAELRQCLAPNRRAVISTN
ncbi:OmpA family protein [Gallibacterium anatis]|uniref:Outer membrane protein II n=1 Tax=Gallibacterium anatis TaxID=750 RepID=A0A1A7P4G9_9PAST|nr:OmpA family protein [Gallibacterium anatis]KGQ54496.1 plastocyanin [Gallibacterium anatis DSM 16844 = F 149]OBW95917.1 plastocyanin [Gallibacterium anatis]OBW96626.1 plastocyanin [Gallibacterium anatis]STO37456.1 Outer membrane protein II* [Gallibacterium anatis]